MNPGSQLDRLAIALAEEIAAETGKSELDILEKIVEAGESLKHTPSKRPAQVRRTALA